VEDREEIENKEEGVQKALEKAEKGEKSPLESELAEMKDRYLRLYAEFENYKKRVQREKEELVKCGNEDLLYQILPAIDNLEMALQHSANGPSEGLVKGVEITFRELLRVLEKFGLIPISAIGRPFDPSIHHAISVVERPDAEDNTVVEEFRKGYMLGNRVLRPSLVSVSKKTTEEYREELHTHEGLKEE
jgi:molecular chaperone GrpE